MLKNLLIVLASIIFCLVLAEVFFRVLSTFQLDYQVEMCRYAALMKRQADPELSHEHVPGMKAKLMGVDVSINSHGFRDPEYTEEKPQHIFRILMLGDSLTFGWGAPADCIFSRLVETKLNQQLEQENADYRVQVINTGVGNYNTSQEVRTLEKRGLEFDPDLVVLNYFINDAEPTSTKGRSPIFKYSYLAMWLWGRIDVLNRTYFSDDTYQNYYAELYDQNNLGWQKTRQALGRLAELQKEHGFALLMTILPELHAVRPKYGFADINAKVVAAAHQAGIDTIVDLAPCFAGENDPPSLWVSPDDAHPNCKAHHIIADGIYEAIVNHNLVLEPQ